MNNPILLKSVCLCSALAVLPVLAQPNNSANAGQVVEFTQLLVKPADGLPNAALEALVRANKGTIVDEIPALGVRVIEVPALVAEKVMAALNNHHDVEYAEQNSIVHAFVTNDPYSTTSYQWYLHTISAPEAWATTVGSNDVVVAVVDTGVNAAHPELVGKVLSQDGYDFINGDPDAADDQGHGTAVAGCVSPNTNNSQGLAGIAWDAKILPVKVLSADGSGTISAVSNGITYAADYGARIINLSLGGGGSSLTMDRAVQYAWGKGAVLIAAAGNSGNTDVQYPAGYNNVLAVSATNGSDLKASFSTYGRFVDVSAPGERIATLNGSNGYSYMNGTSFSSPIIAGVAVLVASAPANLTNTQIVDILTRGVDDLGPVGYDISFGHGRINAAKAAELAFASTAVDTTAPEVTIYGPEEGSTVSGLVVVEVDATDDTAVSRIALSLNGEAVGDSAGSRIVYEIDTTGYANGALKISAVAQDIAGNVGGAVTHLYVSNDVAVDTEAPIATILSPTEGTVVTGRSVTISTQATDNVGVTLVELYVDGSVYRRSTEPNVNFSWNLRKVAEGAHTLQTVAYDAAGNYALSDLVTVTKGASSGGRGNKGKKPKR